MPSRQGHRSDRRPKRRQASSPRRLKCATIGGLYCKEAWKAITKMLAISPPEAELARRVLECQTHGEIARALGVSRSTVSSRKRCLYEKLQVTCGVRLVSKFFATYMAWTKHFSSFPAGCPGPKRIKLERIKS
jgi:DNA-binding NarL/FixJ family response regulator